MPYRCEDIPGHDQCRIGPSKNCIFCKKIYRDNLARRKRYVKTLERAQQNGRTARKQALKSIGRHGMAPVTLPKLKCLEKEPDA